MNADDGNPVLPELCQGELDEALLAAYFRDLGACTRIDRILPKFTSRGHVHDQAITLEAARALLVTRRARALQIVYEYDGSAWIDTVMQTPGETFRMVRIRAP